MDFEGASLENFFSTLNISKTPGGICTKFSAFGGLYGPSLPFGPEVAEGPNFGGSGAQSGQNRHLGLRVGRFGEVPEILPKYDSEFLNGDHQRGYQARPCLLYTSPSPRD